MKKSGPYLNSFFFCERVLTEKDGVNSAIRLVNSLRITKPETDKRVPGYSLSMLIGLKSGDFKGMCQLTLAGTRPSGTEFKRETIRIELEGGDRGMDVIVNAQLAFPEEGTYWFALYVEDELVTKTPLSVVFAKTKSSDGSGAVRGQQPERSPSPTGSAPRGE